MGMIMLVLLGCSVFLLLLSFLQKDPYKELKEEIDQLTIQQVQEIYQIKKKLKLFEEELLVSDDGFTESVVPAVRNQKEIHDIIKNQVWSLAQQGKPIEQIASQSSLSIEDVFSILREYSDRGKRNE